MAKQMNIVYIHTHDSGKYIEPYGYAVPTPNLMDFAKQSTLFRNCHCAGPTCSPSRAALLTGTWPHVNGMLGLAQLGNFTLNDYNMHMARYFKSHGYETVLSGIQHEASETTMIGYDRVLIDNSMNKQIGNAEEADTNAATLAANYLRSRKGSTNCFFLSVGLYSTHLPYESVGNINQDYVMVPHVVYDCEDTRKDMAGYIHSASIADRCIGIVLTELKEAGFDDNTIVFFTTDHGIAFPHMKCTLYDSGTNVSLIFRYPGNPMQGKSTDALVSHIDVFPTLCDLCDIEKPVWLKGRSLLNILTRKSEVINEEVFSELTYHVVYEPLRSIRTERYKLIKRFDSNLDYILPNTDESNSKNFLVDNGFTNNRMAQREMLFDLYFDPMERENLFGNALYLDVYNNLSKRLAAWMEHTGDPLNNATQRVATPYGVRVTESGILLSSN